MISFVIDQAVQSNHHLHATRPAWGCELCRVKRGELYDEGAALVAEGKQQVEIALKALNELSDNAEELFKVKSYKRGLTLVDDATEALQALDG